MNLMQNRGAARIIDGKDEPNVKSGSLEEWSQKRTNLTLIIREPQDGETS